MNKKFWLEFVMVGICAFGAGMTLHCILVGDELREARYMKTSAVFRDLAEWKVNKYTGKIEWTWKHPQVTELEN